MNSRKHWSDYKMIVLVLVLVLDLVGIAGLDHIGEVDFERWVRMKLIVELVDCSRVGVERIAASDLHSEIDSGLLVFDLVADFAIDPSDSVKRDISSFAVDYQLDSSLKSGTRSYMEIEPLTSWLSSLSSIIRLLPTVF